MKLPAWLSPALYGAVAGAIVLAIVGFSWGGWVTGSTASEMSENAAETAVVESLTPYCVRLSQQDPNAKAVLAEMKAASNYNRRGIVEKAGWATPLGKEEPNRDLARACEKAISES